MDQEEEPGGALFRGSAGHSQVTVVYREGLKEISEHPRMGVCPVRLRRLRQDPQAFCYRLRVWIHLPLEGGVERLHLHSLSASVTSRRKRQLSDEEMGMDTRRHISAGNAAAPAAAITDLC